MPISLVRKGIYANPTAKGDAVGAGGLHGVDRSVHRRSVRCQRRAADPGRGLRRSRSNNPKNGLQFFFRSEYGLSKLDYPALPGHARSRRLTRLGLREIWNYSWTGDSGWRIGADYLRDLFARDTMRDMGGLTPHGRPVQVYINGLYWGLYIMTERIDEDFAADHLGGDKEDYDVSWRPPATRGRHRP